MFKQYLLCGICICKLQRQQRDSCFTFFTAPALIAWLQHSFSVGVFSSFKHNIPTTTQYSKHMPPRDTQTHTHIRTEQEHSHSLDIAVIHRLLRLSQPRLHHLRSVSLGCHRRRICPPRGRSCTQTSAGQGHRRRRRRRGLVSIERASSLPRIVRGRQQQWPCEARAGLYPERKEQSCDT